MTNSETTSSYNRSITKTSFFRSIKNQTSLFENDTMSYSMHPILDIVHRVETVLLPCLLVIGTVCNIITFLVMRRRRMRVSSTCFYMAVLSITDTLVLWTGCLNQWFYLMQLPTLVIQSNFTCKMLTFLFVTFADFSVWTIVCMSFERYFAVSRPLSASQTCTVKRAKLVLTGILLLFSFIDGHFLFTLNIVNQNHIPVCMPKPWAVYFVENVFIYIDAIKYSALPFIILIVLSILIITKVSHAEGISAQLQNLKQLNQISNAKPSICSASRVGRRVTFMLLSVSIAFCIFSAPMSLMQIVQSYYSDNKKHHSKEVHISLVIGKSVAEISQYINHSINFFLYVMTGGVFRLEFTRLFFPNRYYPVNSKRCSIYSFDNRSVRGRAIGRNGLITPGNTITEKHRHHHHSLTLPSVKDELNNDDRQVSIGNDTKYSLLQKADNISSQRHPYTVSQLRSIKTQRISSTNVKLGTLFSVIYRQEKTRETNGIDFIENVCENDSTNNMLQNMYVTNSPRKKKKNSSKEKSTNNNDKLDKRDKCIN